MHPKAKCQDEQQSYQVLQFIIAKYNKLNIIQSNSNLKKQENFSKQQTEKKITKRYSSLKIDKHQLGELYQKHLLSRPAIAQELNQKNLKQIGNIFYNSIRTLVNKLNAIERQKKVFQKNTLNNTFLLNIVHLSLQINQIGEQRRIDQKFKRLLIHQVKKIILMICFNQVQLTNDQLWELIKALRRLKFKYKSFKLSRNISRSQNKKFQTSMRVLKFQIRQNNNNQQKNQQKGEQKQQENDPVKVECINQILAHHYQIPKTSALQNNNNFKLQERDRSKQQENNTNLHVQSMNNFRFQQFNNIVPPFGFNNYVAYQFNNVLPYEFANLGFGFGHYAP